MDGSAVIGPELKDERNQALLEHWLERRGAETAAARLHIDLADLPDLKPYVYILDRDDSGSVPGLYRWQLMGPGLVSLMGSDLTDRIFEDVQTPAQDVRFADIFGAIVGQPCGAVIWCSGRVSGRRTIEMEQLHLPLLNHRGEPTIILAHVAIVGDRNGDLDDLSPLESVTINRFVPFDLGAGVPGGHRPREHQKDPPHG